MKKNYSDKIAYLKSLPPSSRTAVLDTFGLGDVVSIGNEDLPLPDFLGCLTHYSRVHDICNVDGNFYTIVPPFDDRLCLLQRRQSAAEDVNLRSAGLGKGIYDFLSDTCARTCDHDGLGGL